ncbi:MAG TPA: carbon-nitrogen hydrolase family protein [Candidatus Bathyarchaeia archaeon]|jgi:deaminated glutathione amidase|nr:carbon-nitrogen hydrolase family protein [Candidatus Bathyarchaeia archaeon]
MEKSHRVAIVQMKSSTDKEENLRISLDFVKEGARRKARLICFPEFQMAFSSAKQSSKQLTNVAESAKNGNFIVKLCSAARSYKIDVVATIYEKSEEQSFKRVYDTAVLINSKGNIISRYRKVHLYDALGFKESLKLMAGNSIEEPSATSTGSIGLMICYDIRFPEISRILAVQGAEILAAPSAWIQGVMKEEHWVTLLKARSIENGLYMVAPDQVGNIFSGRSMVIDPFGSVILDMGNREAMEIVDIDISRVQSVRKSLPLLKNRRNDVYRNHLGAFT